jgi:circadian clock protein KaiB
MAKKPQKKIKVKVESKDDGGEKYILKLFVTGILPNSARAIVNIKAICEKYLPGRYELEIIDIYQQPSLAVSEKIVAVPLLIRQYPLPEIRMIGDLSNIENVLKGLDLV